MDGVDISGHRWTEYYTLSAADRGSRGTGVHYLSFVIPLLE